MSDIVIYEDGNLELRTTIKNESIWLSQKQMETLFCRDSNLFKIIKHLFPL
jgi:hypothetical protein